MVGTSLCEARKEERRRQSLLPAGEYLFREGDRRWRTSRARSRRSHTQHACRRSRCRLVVVFASVLVKRSSCPRIPLPIHTRPNLPCPLFSQSASLRRLQQSLSFTFQSDVSSSRALSPPSSSAGRQRLAVAGISYDFFPPSSRHHANRCPVDPPRLLSRLLSALPLRARPGGGEEEASSGDCGGGGGGGGGGRGRRRSRSCWWRRRGELVWRWEARGGRGWPDKAAGGNRGKLACKALCSTTSCTSASLCKRCFVAVI